MSDEPKERGGHVYSGLMLLGDEKVYESCHGCKQALQKPIIFVTQSGVFLHWYARRGTVEWMLQSVAFL
jgi:hypothetical protein